MGAILNWCGFCVDEYEEEEGDGEEDDVCCEACGNAVPEVNAEVCSEDAGGVIVRALRGDGGGADEEMVVGGC